MKVKKLLLKLSLFLLFIVPVNVFAYSDKIVVGGENIGINVSLDYVSIVGFYEVNGTYIGEDAGFKLGDKIKKINNQKINDIDDMVSVIQSVNSKEIEVTVERNNEEFIKKLSLVEENNGVLKTGLYVKDKVTGIGTLTYIDPTTGVFGSLGHEILDKNTLQKVEIKDGKIFKSEVIGVNPSESGKPGEKNAKFFSDETFGTISKNEPEGVFGSYEEDVSSYELTEVASLDEVKLGKAVLRTVIKGHEIKDYEIDIIEIDENNDTKNILFEITDQVLLEKTGGVVAGMSGSPILQDGKIIAACTHVVVNSPEKGFAIAIEKMLEKGES